MKPLLPSLALRHAFCIVEHFFWNALIRGGHNCTENCTRIAEAHGGVLLCGAGHETPGDVVAKPNSKIKTRFMFLSFIILFASVPLITFALH